MTYLEPDPKCYRCVGGNSGIQMEYVKTTGMGLKKYKCPMCEDVYYRGADLGADPTFDWDKLLEIAQMELIKTNYMEDS